MPYITTVLYSYIPNSGWEFETVTTFVSSLSSRSFDLTRHATSTRHSTFSTSTLTSTSTPSELIPESTSTTARPTFARPSISPSTLPSIAQPSQFPTDVVIGVSAAILILLIVLVSLLAWKGKLGHLNLIQNPYVTKMKRQAQDERVRKVEQERLEEVRRRERERAKERGWGIGNERESRIMEGNEGLPGAVDVTR